VIVRAGPAGLFAARELVIRSELQVVVLERGPDLPERLADPSWRTSGFGAAGSGRTGSTPRPDVSARRLPEPRGHRGPGREPGRGDGTAHHALYESKLLHRSKTFNDRARTLLRVSVRRGHPRDVRGRRDRERTLLRGAPDRQHQLRGPRDDALHRAVPRAHRLRQVRGPPREPRRRHGDHPAARRPAPGQALHAGAPWTRSLPGSTRETRCSTAWRSSSTRPSSASRPRWRRRSRPVRRGGRCRDLAGLVQAAASGVAAARAIARRSRTRAA